MIYPSAVEGFGLPMVEAMSRGLRVFASDIAVFREVGEGFAVFFSLDRPESLAERLEDFCRDGKFPAARSVCEFAWPDWPASTRQLFDLALGHFGRHAR
jgi:alpha-1,2-rhamnosyltransferase